jgi:hypothetical protein
MANKTGKGGWEKGKSGNPNGRPPKSRALTDILEKAGSQSVEVDGKKVASKRIVASLLWQVATTGTATFPDGSILSVSPQDWIAVVKFLYTQIDGPPKAEMDVTSNGETIPVSFIDYRVGLKSSDDSTDA